MDKIYFAVEVRDAEGNLYLDEDGSRLTSIEMFETGDYGFDIMGIACEGIVKKFKAICKEGSKINIHISYKDSISSTYTTLYSYYGAEKRFIKH